MASRAPHRRALRPLTRTTIALLAALLALSCAGGAVAAVGPPAILDGPANNIVSVAGASLARDGSGGVVYLKVIAGVTHVFVARLVGGRWLAPVQADREDPYGALQPAIAASEDGRLLVVWVQPRNSSSRGVLYSALMGASLQPGAGDFGAAVMIDPYVSEQYTGDASTVSPRLAAAPNGAAYAVYRVTTDDCSGSEDGQNPQQNLCPVDGHGKIVSVRVARFAFNRTWGSPVTVNRAPQIAMRDPVEANRPAIGVDLRGNGLVAWQEPGIDGVARIWVRRLFGDVAGNVAQVSPSVLGGQPVTSDADAPSLATGPFGEALLAYRVDGGAGSSVPVARLFTSLLSGEVDPAPKLSAPEPLPGPPSDGLGAPSAALDPRGNARVAWSDGLGAMLALSSKETGAALASIGAASGAVFTAIDPAGGGTSAWLDPQAGLVDVREEYPGGGLQVARLAGGVPGAAQGLSLGDSGQGDALLGWMQGPVGRSEVLGDLVWAPPSPFVVQSPIGWQRAPEIPISWEPAGDIGADVHYSVYVDGRPRLTGLHSLSAELATRHLGDGRHRLQILARDAAGQVTRSAVEGLAIDTTPPYVRVRPLAGGRGVRVLVSDRASGVDARATRVAFGDSAHAAGRATAAHVYRRPGRYTLTVRVRDRAGNRALVRLRVSVL